MTLDSTRQILAATINPFATQAIPPSVLMTSFVSVFIKAWGASGVKPLSRPKGHVEGTLFAEGPRLMTEIGAVNIIRMPIQDIDDLTDVFLSLVKGDDSEASPTPNLMVMALGSPVFCKNIIRFVGLQRDGKVDDSIHKLTSRVALAVSSQVIWTDTETGDDLHENNLITLAGEAREKGVIQN